MYSYIYCNTTGGILLNSTPTGFSKEPRPVYAPELDLLGFDKYWEYKKQTDTPYMWAEANRYFYYGRLVAQLRGGNVYQAPEIIIPNDESGKPITPEPENAELRPIDIAGMVEANYEILSWFVGTTEKKILAVYEKHKDKLDIFHVAFSGGKDSCVLLDLVKRVLPHDSFVVVFGDTGMEFTDTYEVINNVEEQCLEDGIKFFRATSHLSPKESWDLFAPPSRILRWCCSVHKSTPQTLKLREVTGKQDYVGLDYVGVRAQESFARSEYEYENFSKKQKGQYSHNSILEWTSAEIWIYIYSRGVIINNAYKKGNGRVGCLFCPMSGGAGDYIRRQNYTEEIDGFIEVIRKSNNWDSGKKNHETYITSGGWDNRRSGRGITGNVVKYFEKTQNGIITITVSNPSSDWHEWIKTIDDSKIRYKVADTKDGYTISISEISMKESSSYGKLFRQVFRKAAYCVGCKVCEANCQNGKLTFVNGKVKIDGCLRCGDCHKLQSGCLMYESRKVPQEEKRMKTINCFDDHAPMPKWIADFFTNKNAFFESNDLGPNQLKCFRRFLRDADLQDKNHITPFAEIIANIGYDRDTAMGLILINLVTENPQIEWYVQNLDVGSVYERTTVEGMLIALDIKDKAARSIVKSFKRLVETPLGTKLNFGYVDGDTLVRTTCSVSDARVILYALYKFAEKCNDHKEFTLNELLSDNIERDGVSPTRIFGLDREAMIPILLGLSASNPDFINATFTNDLDKISLKDDITSADVLDLFREGN